MNESKLLDAREDNPGGLDPPRAELRPPVSRAQRLKVKLYEE